MAVIFVLILVQERRLSESAEEDGLDGLDGAGLSQEKDRDERTGATALNRSQSINRHRLVAHSTPIESIQAESKPIDEQPNVPYVFLIFKTKHNVKTKI